MKVRMIRPRINFYPRSPCGERLENGFAGVLFLIDISIHALLAESDCAAGSGFC